ncbi:multidrug ABC transporter ATP-binding protein [Thermotoga sp. RQ7]|uniref:ABC transporter ATP-binding protein n=1 Tax=Thermotoga sp. RQ7 TaxID=126738 RepID=UPI0005A32E86|nr:ABC transporter ATP-binding protein [Thermotoga sp. RQ7]AJG40262.1 multidrug ABC transporter ATP-binding protein [Thermotoga sp. RQ7]
MGVVIVEDLKKSIGRREILKGISFEIKEGEIFGLIGPNGAGKTTTLRILSTLIKPSSGKVSIFGKDVTREPHEARKLISYLPEEAGAYRNMKGIEYLRFVAGFYMRNSREMEAMVEKAVEISGLGDRVKDRISTYSKGMVRKLLIARSLMVNPRLAILDEPTSGLDVLNAREVRKILKRAVREGLTILLSSHNMLEVEYLCDRIALIHDGRIVESGTVEELKERYSAQNIEEVFEEVVKCSENS